MRINWQHWNSFISKEECEEIAKICYEEGTFTDATVFSQQTYQTDSSIRSTKVGWMNNPKITELVQHYLLEANRNAFGFNVDFIPPVQFGEYTEGSFYTWHHDIDWNGDSMYDRKLSIVVQLSDENDYEGGDFQFKTIEQPLNFRAQGSILVFPSYNVHRVTEVTKGTRLSLVCWMEGPRWR